MAQMYYGTGRRKSSVARVRLIPGTGNVTINGKALDEYFPMEIVKREVIRPFEVAGCEGKFDVIAKVEGDGFTGQAGALRHGVSRALCEADIENNSYSYSYDATGNISGSIRVENGKATITRLSYDTTSGWYDRLIKVGSTDITYSDTAPGLSVSYYNGKNSFTFTWDDQGRLNSTTANSKPVGYLYDVNGLRTFKRYGTNNYYFYYDGDRLLAQKWGTKFILFYYDENDSIYSFRYYDGSLYSKYYLFKNLQGDVVEIRDNHNGKVATYKYDPWGNIISITDSSGTAITDTTHIAYINPIRYRSYYYDVETGFYYLQSRYYDPANARFISADDPGIIGVVSNSTSMNLFAYCMNNPVNMSDHAGNWPKWATVVLGAAAAVAAVAVTAATLGAAAPAAACTLTTIGMSLGASYAVSNVAATVAVVATTTVASAYAGDIAYSTVTGDSLLLDTVFQGNEAAYNTGLAISSVATSGMLQLASQSPGICFIAGTPVLTALGHVSIEKITVGDMVWASDPETGDVSLKEVVQTFVNETNELFHIFVNGEEITTTPEHPFYNPVKGWTSAAHLRSGDILVLVNGSYVVVEKVQHELFETPITVYNFEVADYHTYYVGYTAVLVHNTCGEKSSS